MFHAKDGLFFERLDDGAVRVTKKNPNDPALVDMVLDKDLWCSIISQVSFKPEDSEQHDKAESFHLGTCRATD